MSRQIGSPQTCTYASESVSELTLSKLAHTLSVRANSKMFRSKVSISQTCLPWSELWALQRYRTRGAPSPLPRPLKNAQKYFKRNVPGTTRRAHLGEEHVKWLSGCAEVPYQGRPLIKLTIHRAPRMPNNSSKKCAWYQARRHVCAKARLRNHDKGKQRGQCGVKQGRFVILRFPCFTVFGGPKVAKCWEKLHEKCHCHAPFCAPQTLVKSRSWEQCPHRLAGKARGKWQIDPILPTNKRSIASGTLTIAAQCSRRQSHQPNVVGGVGGNHTTNRQSHQCSSAITPI